MCAHVSDYIREYYPEYYRWLDYPAEDVVVINKADEEWGILGNFGRTPLVVDGVPFYASESLFQVMKFTDPDARKAVHAWKGLCLKKVARHYENTVGPRPDWGRIIVDALKFCLMTKYGQSEAFRTELARTGNRTIVEKAHGRRADTYSALLSADGTTWTGGNLMGRLLMELRATGKLEYHLPEDAMRFRDLAEE